MRHGLDARTGAATPSEPDVVAGRDTAAATDAGTARPATLRGSIVPWIATAADTIVPLAVGIAAVLLFSLLEQARDALFGALGSPATGRDGRSTVAGIGLFCCYAVAVAVFGNLLWYTSRVMVLTSLRRTARVPGHRQARRHYPRLLAYVLSSLLMGVPVFLAHERTTSRPGALALAGAASLLPLVLVLLAQRRTRRRRRWAWTAAAATTVAELALMLAVPPEGGAWQTGVALALACAAPTACYVLWVTRRSWMKIGADPAALLVTYRRRLAGFVLLCAAIFATLGFAPTGIPRALGSPGIAMIALCGFLVGFVTLALTLRMAARRMPGVAQVGVLVALAAAVLVRVAGGVEPWREIPAEERLAASSLDLLPPGPPAPYAPAPAPDIVVNAYGGGLRAALYTASLLAALDDRSCGAFGRRIHALSGVSGGSVGIATYLVARQRLVRAGGWTACDGTRAVLGELVEDALRRDHLSPVLARMLTVDLLPFSPPQRGQALLDSWNEAIQRTPSSHVTLPPTAGLAMPLTSLTGGIYPAPLVLFNATQATTGKIFWMSNEGRWGTEDDTVGQPAALQLGQAVLHSARFPIVSPVGRFAQAPAGRDLLVDGGLSDNSGIVSLARRGLRATGTWLDIDGNFDTIPCGRRQPAGVLPTWSTLSALLALRAKQASNAEAAVGGAGLTRAKLAYYPERLGHDAACAAIARLHMAPLGWYMSVRSADDMKQAIEAEAARVCRSLGNLCMPSSGATPAWPGAHPE